MSSSKYSVSVLKLRNFRMLLMTRMFVMTALQAQSVIVGWQIYSLTKSAFLLGLTGLAEAVPAISCALVAGHVVDNGHPHKIYIGCTAALMLNTLLLMVFAGGFAPIDHQTLLYLLFGGVFFSGLARSFTAPASFTLLSQIVKREEMPSATAWNGTGFQIAAIGGPAIAGIVYGGYGPKAWLLPALLMMGAFIAVNGIKLGALVRGEKRENAIKSIRAGWKFIWTHKVLLSMMSLDMFAVLFGGATAMLPAYADQVLHVGSEGLGALRAAPAIGAVGMTLMLALKPMKHLSAARLLWVVAAFGVCMIGFGASTNFWLSLFFLALSGMFDSINMTIRGTLMQLLTPDNMRGRVSSISSMFIISSNEIGAFESGTAARLLGLVPSVILGGIGTLIVCGAIAVLSPAFRRTVVDSHAPDKA
jgi:MFS family permease